MKTRFAFLAAFALACTGEGKDSGSDSSTGTGTCPDGRFNGPTTIQQVNVECTGTSVRFSASTEGWTDGGMVFSQETGNPEPQWSDEHDLDSYQFDACGFEDNVERVIDDGDTLADPLNDWNRNVSSVFQCDQHYESPGTMTYAFMVFDIDGNFADCLAFGDNVADMKAGTSDRINEPSFDLSGCAQGATTRAL